MKQIVKLIFLSTLLGTLTWSCKKDETKIFFEGGVPPVVSSSVTNNIPLSFANKDKEALKLSWTNPDYQFTTGLSSQNVTYQIEIDTAGSNFTNPQKQTVTVSNDLSKSFTQGEFNDFLLNQLVLDTAHVHNLEIRVKSFLGTNAVPLYSNVLKFTINPYPIPPKVPPPSSGHLFLVGSATAGAWNNPVPLPNQEFTKISPTLYQITIPLMGGNEYLFLPVNGDWSHKYAVKNNPAVPGLSDGGDFGFDFSDNFPGPAATGSYKIEVDFQRGKFKVTKL